MLEYVLDSRPKVLILRLLAERRDWIFSLSEISRELKVPKNTISRSIKPLVEYNILREFKKGKSTVFQLNKNNYIVEQIIVPLFNVESQYPFKKASEFCYLLITKRLFKRFFSVVILFGSASEGKMTPTSDIDIALIMKEEPRSLKKDIEALKSKYFKEEGLIFSVNIFNPEEFKMRYAKKDPLIMNIANGKIIYGDIDEVI